MRAVTARGGQCRRAVGPQPRRPPLPARPPAAMQHSTQWLAGSRPYPYWASTGASSGCLAVAAGRREEKSTGQHTGTTVGPGQGAALTIYTVVLLVRPLAQDGGRAVVDDWSGLGRGQAAQHTRRGLHGVRLGGAGVGLCGAEGSVTDSDQWMESDWAAPALAKYRAAQRPQTRATSNAVDGWLAAHHSPAAPPRRASSTPRPQTWGPSPLETLSSGLRNALHRSSHLHSWRGRRACCQPETWA